MPFTTQDFAGEIQRILAQEEAAGKTDVTLKSGDIHRRVGVYPASNHRMPCCCDAMKKQMSAGDEIVSEPPSGKGASLTVLYRLPRNTESL